MERKGRSLPLKTRFSYVSVDLNSVDLDDLLNRLDDPNQLIVHGLIQLKD